MAGPRGGGRPDGPGRAGMPIQKPKDMKATIVRIWSYISAEKGKLAIAMTCVVLNAVANLAASYMLRPIVNAIADFDGNWAHLIDLMVRLALVYVVAITLPYLQMRIMLNISQRALQHIRQDLFDKVQRLPLRFYDTNNHGDVMSRFTNDIDNIGEMLNSTLANLINGIFTIIGTLFLMFYTNWILALVTVLLTPILTWAGLTVAKLSRKHYKAQQESLGNLNGYIEETITGQKVVKVFCHEDQAIEEFSKKNLDLRKKQIKAQFFGGIMGPVMGNLSQVNYSLTAMIGGILCVLRGFDIGGLTVFVSYSRNFSRPINELSMQMTTVFSALAGAERAFAVMDEAPEPEDKEGALDPVIDGSITLENVTFGYEPDKTILKNISFYAKKGQKIALVGSTGAGKTTITNLVNRFYDIDEGRILIDGIDIKDIKMETLRRNIAFVLQDTHLFTGTVRENIRYGRPDATDAEVEQAAKMASAHSFIVRLEKGYDTMIEGDGANLSQGQRQLLNIARAAISKAPILVLDEATSSVDTRTEKQIEKGMDRLMAERTTVVIAHRLSTVRNANAIMVLEHGEIIERGDHDDLLAQKGRYYNLYTGLSQLD